MEEVQRAKRRFDLEADVPVKSCYEAGRDGFWLHRFLQSHGIDNVVIDASSLEVKRRARRVKTDRIDATKLLTMLQRYWGGERKLWSVVRAPSVEEEDRRQLHRQLWSAKSERTRLTNRIKGLLASQGIKRKLTKGWIAELDSIRLWDGSGLAAGLKSRLKREWAKVELLNEHIRELNAERREILRSRERDAVIQKVHRLMLLRGIGIEGAWISVMELFGWREFRNRREIGGVTGLTAAPWRSGDGVWEQGISKAGNPSVRGLAVELAWGWLRHQPDSALSRWYERRFGGGSSTQRRVGIVALARKLLVVMWRFLETGEVPEGARLKPKLVI